MQHGGEPGRGAVGVVPHCHRPPIHGQALPQLQQHCHSQQDQKHLIAWQAVEQFPQLRQGSQDGLVGKVDARTFRPGEQVHR